MKITQHSFGCQTIEEEFTGKNLTLFGGLGLVSKFFGGLRLCKTLRILDKQFPRRENGYEVSHLILALIYGLIVGKFRPYEISYTAPVKSEHISEIENKLAKSNELRKEIDEIKCKL